MNKLIDKNQIPKYFRLKRYFMNETIIYHVNITNSNADEIMIPSIIRKISQRKEVIDFDHIFHTKHLEKGFMIISMNSGIFL